MKMFKGRANKIKLQSLEKANRELKDKLDITTELLDKVMLSEDLDGLVVKHKYNISKEIK